MIYNINFTSIPEVLLLGRIRQVGYWNYRIHPASDHLFVIVLSGHCIFEIDGVQHPVGTGECFFLPQHTLHRVYTDTDCEYYFLHFRTTELIRALDDRDGQDRIREQIEQARERPAPSPFEMHPTRHDSTYFAQKIILTDRLDAVLLLLAKCDGARFDPDPNKKLLVDLYFAELVLLFSSITLGSLLSESHVPLVLSRMVVHIQQHYTQAITLASLAEEFRLSKQYIIRLFRTYLNTTVTRYINTLKLYHAQEFLKYSRMNINEIAAFLGFSNAYYFSRLFRRTFLLTPSEYIKSELEIAGRQGSRPDRHPAGLLTAARPTEGNCRDESSETIARPTGDMI